MKMLWIRFCSKSFGSWLKMDSFCDSIRCFLRTVEETRHISFAFWCQEISIFHAYARRLHKFSAPHRWPDSADWQWPPAYWWHCDMQLKRALESIFAIFPFVFVPTRRPLPPNFDRPSWRVRTVECLDRAVKWQRTYLLAIHFWNVAFAFDRFRVRTFGMMSVKLILSTRSVTKVYGSGIDASKFGMFMCWCTTQTANRSISSIKRPKRTLPKNVTYLSCNLLSVDSGITADVNEFCIDLGGNSLIDLGSYCSKCSRLCFKTV